MTTADDRSSGDRAYLLGVDTGGTFTDFVLFDSERLRVAKRPSTPDAPERAVLDGAAGLAPADGPAPRLVHGSTVATNALLEGKTARTAYIANEGLADVLTIGRQNRSELYKLEPACQAPPVPFDLCLEVAQRSAPDGADVTPLDAAALEELVARVRKLDPEAVAVNLLYSFVDDSAERRIERALIDALGADVTVCRSSRVLPEYREYERGIATWINAALGPRVGRYLGRLKAGVGPLAVMHGAAGTVDVDQAADHAVNLLLSGPAAGLLGARFAGRLAGEERLLTFDMGGTSTDVALIDGGIRLTSEGTIAGYPVAVPMVDMHTIGAGGGSLARVDAGAMLRVGPESAGADPGPACYGGGGERPTVTDANVVLGRLPASTRLGGDMALDVAAARKAMGGLTDTLGVDVAEAAEGVIRVANEAMAQALRVISVQRGEDPRDYVLLCFGGAGGMHVCALAEALGMRRALVPVYAGVLSALGMLAARRSRELSHSVLKPLAAIDAAAIDRRLADMRERGRRELAAEGVPSADMEARISADLRYAGQSFTLSLPWRGPEETGDAFHAAHEARYGHRLDLDVELVNLRLSLQGPEPSLPIPQLARGDGVPDPVERVHVHDVDGDVPVYAREDLLAGQRFAGPAIVRERVSTTWVAPGWGCAVDDYGNLRLQG
ncbi:5-oxoprolinase [Salinisphaera sp. PC39]|uniref:hydantoinase/oxoprolinase family protein n=1 Tax=Salinisphaera sp. PC39 TaxID=1304156 RepID=UPI003342587D